MGEQTDEGLKVRTEFQDKSELCKQQVKDAGIRNGIRIVWDKPKQSLTQDSKNYTPPRRSEAFVFST